ncbi:MULTISPECIES: hypothetical protein [unclassified Neorhizobium]|uniref:hypothetical protein n=1 Tax=unclassified Neorhizobium TaxID=2629175 RepID=UPI001FF31210|nr:MULTISPECIES: hypothetical protein [unclassified Neorhizobium]MCJ9673044.1 hypothetical protein [Neorhizobium sp. SHOUNA12B]MCJ9748554.1 hypothetical protein [Neorhizobium sp. SHOUNA12A]
MLKLGIAEKWHREAKTDPRLKPIIEEVEKAYKVRIAVTSDPEWASAPDKKTAEIEVSDTLRPLPSFAHEYLHLRLSARGYRHILASINFNLSKNAAIGRLLSALDNELQHHRMFDDFVKAGFDGVDFYAESDGGAHIAVKKQIEALTFQSDPADALPSFLSVIAPGGRWPDDEREALRQLIEKTCPAATWSKLLKIEGIIDRWKQQDGLNPLNTIAEILEALGGYDDTFIGENVTTYPCDGAILPRMNMNPTFDKAVRDALAAQHGKQ